MGPSRNWTCCSPSRVVRAAVERRLVAADLAAGAALRLLQCGFGVAAIEAMLAGVRAGEAGAGEIATELLQGAPGEASDTLAALDALTAAVSLWARLARATPPKNRVGSPLAGLG